MTVSERTTFFNIAVGIFNIVLGLLIEFILIGGSLLLLAKYPAIANGISTNVLLPFVLLAGIIIAMVISIKTITWFIKAFHMEDKLDQKVVRKYIKPEL